ncbi:M56 family metallopeptidase [Brumimicrobium aurantiacum]|uniref:TonB family protein n=1 Tax=Brumimicrobium aurantiacum TaxID=1737063 RepID=A0A3E1EXJ4_9FLAO|nr:M56 family metallopeptidase [Brumimicrobium aurantiacum]RFC54286.1 TonB family protein [Brumimicrobium aurantiacum]
MTEFIIFNIYFLICTLVYRFVLDKKGVLKWNRWVLLFMPVSLCLIVKMSSLMTVNSSLFTVELDFITIQNTGFVKDVNFEEYSVSEWILVFYLLGVSVFCIYHIYNFFKLSVLIRKSKLLMLCDDYKVLSSEFNASFFNIIFIQKGLTESEERLILAHEYAHVRQKHSYDRILVLIVQSLCWFNPAVYLWKSDVEKNHEYLADQEVLKSIDRKEYTLFLLEQQLQLNLNQFHLPLSNMSNLKSRVMKMNSKKGSVMSYLVLPVLAVGMMSSRFIPEVHNQNIQSSINYANTEVGNPIENPDEMPEFKGGMDALVNYLSNEIVYPKESMKNNSSGKVFLEAVITEEGKVTKVKVLRGVDEFIDAEAVRVFNAMPDWIPAVKDGRKVACAVTLPIHFALDNTEKGSKE